MNSKSFFFITLFISIASLMLVVRSEELNSFDMDLQNYDSQAQQQSCSSCSSCPNFHSDDEGGDGHGSRDHEENDEHH